MIYLLQSLITLLIGIGCASGIPQNPALKPIMLLPRELDECSGMVSLGNELYAGLNDSGNAAELYIFSLKPGQKTKVVTILGASNDDWEELAADHIYMYIGDTGNNDGNRKNLRIYRIKKNDLLNQTEVQAELISFHYPEQKLIQPSNHHNFDCEALVAVGDSLYLFTKNRGDSQTDLYSIPAVPGKYAARHLDRFDADGLVTGADYRQKDGSGELILIGYTIEGKGYHPFIIYFPQVSDTGFFKGSPERFTFSGRLQTETILFHDEHTVFVSNEEEHGDKGFIYQVDIRK